MRSKLNSYRKVHRNLYAENSICISKLYIRNLHAEDQNQGEKIAIYTNENTFKVLGKKKMRKDEFTWNPRWGQNEIDKFTLQIFVPILTFKRRFDVCFVVSGK